MAYNETLAEIRQLLEQPPARELWLELCRVLETMEETGEQEWLVQYIDKHSRHWPLSAKWPPEEWNAEHPWWTVSRSLATPSSECGGCVLVGYALEETALNWQILGRLQYHARQLSKQWGVRLVCHTTASQYPNSVEDLDTNTQKLDGTLVVGILVDGVLKVKEEIDWDTDSGIPSFHSLLTNHYDYHLYDDEYMSKGFQFEDVMEARNTLLEVFEGHLPNLLEEAFLHDTGQAIHLERTASAFLVAFGQTNVTKLGFGKMTLLEGVSWEEMDERVPWDLVSGLGYGDETVYEGVAGLDVDSHMNEFDGRLVKLDFSTKAHSKRMDVFERFSELGEEPRYFVVLDAWSGW